MILQGPNWWFIIKCLLLMHVSIITNISSYLVSSLLCARVCVDGFGFYRYLWLLHPEIFPFSYSSNYVFYIGLAVIVVWLLNLLCLERCEFMIDWFDFPIITVVNISHTVVDNIFIRQECWSIYSCQKEKGSWRKRTSRKMVATVLTLMNFFLLEVWHEKRTERWVCHIEGAGGGAANENIGERWTYRVIRKHKKTDESPWTKTLWTETPCFGKGFFA